MSNFCRSCGTQLAEDAKFCASCGATVGAAPTPPPFAPPPAAPQYAPPPPPYYPQQQKPNVWPWIAAALALLIVVAIAVYFATREPAADATATASAVPAIVPPAGSAVTPPAAGAVVQSSVPVGPRVTLYVVSDANVRNMPTAQGNSAVLATLRRGTQVSGNMQIGANGKARWFKLADNTGYISAVNLGETLTAAPVVAAAPASVPGAIYCTVVDRTGSSLRVRSTPNGRVTGGMPHGTRLRVLGEQMDSAGVNWVQVDPDGSYPTGWVSGAHISC